MWTACGRVGSEPWNPTSGDAKACPYIFFSSSQACVDPDDASAVGMLWFGSRVAAPPDQPAAVTEQRVLELTNEQVLNSAEQAETRFASYDKRLSAIEKRVGKLEDASDELVDSQAANLATASLGTRDQIAQLVQLASVAIALSVLVLGILVGACIMRLYAPSRFTRSMIAVDAIEVDAFVPKQPREYSKPDTVGI
jgi:hypothetical protein